MEKLTYPRSYCSHDYLCLCRVPGVLWVRRFPETCKLKNPYLKWNGMWKPWCKADMTEQLWREQGLLRSNFDFILAFPSEDHERALYQWCRLPDAVIHPLTIIYWAPVTCRAQCSVIGTDSSCQWARCRTGGEGAVADPPWVYCLNSRDRQHLSKYVNKMTTESL